MNPSQPQLPTNEPSAQAWPQPGMSDPGGMALPTNAAAAPVSPTDGGAAWLPPTVPLQPQGNPSVAAAPSASSGTVIPAPDIADDGDLIEKEWVVRAKQIVDRTRQDPYQQTKELHKFKAEYMKKRYNKIIEPVEE